VLINLITNAVHAVEGGGKVIVRAQVASPSAVLLEVSDSGHGVRDDDRERIFEPFFTTKPDGKGTGSGCRSSATSSSNIVARSRSIDRISGVPHFA